MGREREGGREEEGREEEGRGRKIKGKMEGREGSKGPWGTQMGRTKREGRRGGVGVGGRRKGSGRGGREGKEEGDQLTPAALSLAAVMEQDFI